MNETLQTCIGFAIVLIWLPIISRNISNISDEIYDLNETLKQLLDRDIEKSRLSDVVNALKEFYRGEE